MWAVTNQTRFNTARSFARDAKGAEIWIVAVRATFSIASHEPDAHVTVADVQHDVCLSPQYFGEPGRTSLRYDIDVVRTKPGTDIILHAHAHAPGGKPARVVDVGVAVGPMVKRLRVVGDRAWRKGWRNATPSKPEPFVSLPIRYERAWGGQLTDSDARSESNPIGVGADATPGAPVPNVEHLDRPIESSRHTGSAAGFGPIPCDWQPRLKFAGTYDERWQRERQPLVPADFQDAYFRCAPIDQQMNGYLHGGEDVVLHNLTPTGRLRFFLPRVSLGFRTRFGRSAIHHRSQLHTVIIEPEERRLTMVWQTALPCHHTLYDLRDTLVVEKQRVPLGDRTSRREESELVAG